VGEGKHRGDFVVLAVALTRRKYRKRTDLTEQFEPEIKRRTLLVRVFRKQRS
jgi:hypothetical protein